MPILANRFLLLFGGVQTSASGSDQTPDAPEIEWDGDEADSRPDFDVIFSFGLGAPFDAAVDDVLRIEYSSDGGSNWSAYLTHTLTSDDIAGTPFDVSGVTPLADDDYLFRARFERDGSPTNWSPTEAVTVDAVNGGTTYYIYGF